MFSFTWQFGWPLCKLVHYIQNISAVCSVYTLTAISVERYVEKWSNEFSSPISSKFNSITFLMPKLAMLVCTKNFLDFSIIFLILSKYLLVFNFQFYIMDDAFQTVTCAGWVKFTSKMHFFNFFCIKFIKNKIVVL